MQDHTAQLDQLISNSLSFALARDAQTDTAGKPFEHGFIGENKDVTDAFLTTRGMAIDQAAKLLNARNKVG